MFRNINKSCKAYCAYECLEDCLAALSYLFRIYDGMDERGAFHD